MDYGSKSKEEYVYRYETFLNPAGRYYFDNDCTNLVTIIGQFTESVVKF